MLFVARLVPRKRDGFTMEDPGSSDEEPIPVKDEQEDHDYHAYE